MLTPHESKHERWLEALSTEPHDATTAEWRRALETCSQCETRLAEMDALLEDLAEAGEEERDVLDRAARRAELQPAPAALWDRRRLALGLAATAASAFVVTRLWPRSPDLEPGGTNRISLSEGPGTLTPGGSVPSFETLFRWDVPLVGWFVVEVFPVDGFDPLATSPRLETNEWTWDQKDVRTWPARIQWEVVSYDALGNVVASYGQEAWRSD